MSKSRIALTIDVAVAQRRLHLGGDTTAPLLSLAFLLGGFVGFVEQVDGLLVALVDQAAETVLVGIAALILALLKDERVTEADETETNACVGKLFVVAHGFSPF